MPPGVLIEPDHGHAVEPVHVVDQDPLALGQHGVVRGVPRHRQSLSDPGHGQMADHPGPPTPTAARRDSFARGSAILVVSWRHTWPQPVQR